MPKKNEAAVGTSAETIPSNYGGRFLVIGRVTHLPLDGGDKHSFRMTHRRPYKFSKVWKRWLVKMQILQLFTWV
jgi:hypothetical protein